MVSSSGPGPDALDPAHVDEIDLQGAAAGGVEAFPCISLPEAEQLVSLPDLGPRQRTVEESFSEFAHRWSQPGRLVLDAVGSPGGVGGQLGGVVLGVSGAAALEWRTWVLIN